jgi:hypothetical protein
LASWNLLEGLWGGWWSRSRSEPRFCTKITGKQKRRAWATVNKISGGGRKSGSGRGKTENPAPGRKRQKARTA